MPQDSMLFLLRRIFTPERQSRFLVALEKHYEQQNRFTLYCIQQQKAKVSQIYGTSTSDDSDTCAYRRQSWTQVLLKDEQILTRVCVYETRSLLLTSSQIELVCCTEILKARGLV
jgi:hypothetical protein